MSVDTATFNTLYPDVDPSRPIPLMRSERFAMAVAAAVLAYGAATGDLLVTVVGLGLVLFSVIAPSNKTPRKIRREAHERFPELTWADDGIAESVRVKFLIPLFWAIIAVVCVLCLYLVPERLTVMGGIIAAAVAAILVWLMPGLSPMWLSAVPDANDPNSPTAASNEPENSQNTGHQSRRTKRARSGKRRISKKGEDVTTDAPAKPRQHLPRADETAEFQDLSKE